MCDEYDSPCFLLKRDSGSGRGALPRVHTGLCRSLLTHRPHGAQNLPQCSRRSRSYIKVYLGNKVSSLATATYSQFGAVLFLVPLTLVAPPTQVPTPTVWLSVAALALLCTAVTLLLFIWLIAHAGPKNGFGGLAFDRQKERVEHRRDGQKSNHRQRCPGRVQTNCINEKVKIVLVISCS